MVQGLDASSKQFLTMLSSIQRRIERAQTQLSSGKRITSASDDPDQVSPLLQTRADLRRAERAERNLTLVQGEVDAGESAVSQAVTLVERAQVLAATGASDTQTAEARLTYASEVDSLLERMVALSQTEFNGRNIFSGDSDQVAPYTIDWTQTDPISAYQGAVTTRKVTTLGGTQISVALTAEELFDNPDATKNVFDSLVNLSTALKNDDSAAIQTATAQLQSAGDHLNNKLSFFGTVQNQISDSLEEANSVQMSLTERLTSIEDADLTEAILELSTATFQQDAALSSWSKVPRTSLFDYL